MHSTKCQTKTNTQNSIYHVYFQICYRLIIDFLRFLKGEILQLYFDGFNLLTVLL